MWWRPGVWLFCLAIVIFACGGAAGDGDTPRTEPPPRRETAPASSPTPAPEAQDEKPQQLRVEIVRSYPHARDGFTQGLLWHEGHLWESTGQYGSSELRKVELETGEVVERVPVGPGYFAEGLARVGERMYQLTWKEGTVFVWDPEDLSAPVSRFSYDGEGWGLCFDGERLVMSDGSDTLTFRDPETFAEIGRVHVTMWDRPVRGLNELECVDGRVYANVWTSEVIVRIDPVTGRVTARIRADGLLEPEERAGTDVLNGIAHRPETETFLITGKNWPRVFEVRWVETGI